MLFCVGRDPSLKMTTKISGRELDAASAPRARARSAVACGALLAGLCVPRTPAFRDWLDSTLRRWRIRPCGAEGHAEAYLTQATQSREYPVPLVAGESALLRVFVMSEGETAETIPPVRATFFVHGAEVRAVDIPAGTVDPALGVAKRIPAEGRAAVDARNVPTLHLTLIPFVSTADNDREAVSVVAGSGPDSEIFRHTRNLLPNGAFEITRHDPVTVDTNDIFEILRDVERIRMLEDGVGRWMGLIPDPEGAADVAYVPIDGNPGKVSVSQLHGEHAADGDPARSADGPGEGHFP